MKKSDSINELSSALCKSQLSYNKLIKEATNPFFKSRYADLAACIESVREPLAANGLSVIQTTDVINETGVIVVETVLMHTSGQWISGRYPLTPSKERDPQSMGSALTYARRYALTAMLGIASEDDDGETASGKTTQPVKPQDTRYEKPTTEPTYNNPAPTTSWTPAITKRAGKVEKDGLKGSVALTSYITRYNEANKTTYNVVSDFKTDELLGSLIKFVEEFVPTNLI